VAAAPTTRLQIKDIHKKKKKNKYKGKSHKKEKQPMPKTNHSQIVHGACTHDDRDKIAEEERPQVKKTRRDEVVR
jgi:hypothetical protein